MSYNELIKWEFDSRDEHREQYERLVADGLDLRYEKGLLEGIRSRLRDGTAGWLDCADLEGLSYAIDPDDVELLEPAGVPEF